MHSSRLMLRRPAAALAGAAILSLGSLSQAAAQNPLDFLFGRNKEQQNTAPAKAAAPPPAPVAAPVPPKRPAAAAPEAVASPSAAAPPAAPVVTAAAPASPTTPGAPLTEKQIVERANAYFNAISSLVGDFTQIGGDGRRLSGNLYLQRPGKIRFEYAPPATLEVVADGTSVAVRDRKLATQDLYAIAQTPLKFLLRERIDLGRDLKIVEVAPENDGVRVVVEDKSTLGGTSKITLYFDKDVANLTRWRIVDPQGFQTTVALANLERNARVDPKLFAISYERILNER